MIKECKRTIDGDLEGLIFFLTAVFCFYKTDPILIGSPLSGIGDVRQKYSFYVCLFVIQKANAT